MRMEAGLDTGPVALMERATIGVRENAGALHDRLAAIGASLIVRALSALERGSLALTPQPEEGVTYAAKIDKAETRLDWHAPALALERKVRGFAPHPGAWFTLEETRIRVLAAEIVDGAGVPGTILDEALTIACGEGALRLLTVQRAGKAPMSAADFLRGTKIARGASLI
jgi:methionyl-tRNA formyltransferase